MNAQRKPPRRRNRTWNAQTFHAAISQRVSGMSYAAIGRAHGVSAMRVGQLFKDRAASLRKLEDAYRTRAERQWVQVTGPVPYLDILDLALVTSDTAAFLIASCALQLQELALVTEEELQRLGAPLPVRKLVRELRGYRWHIQ